MQKLLKGLGEKRFQGGFEGRGLELPQIPAFHLPGAS